jgi:hypothetical protein
MRTPPWAWLDLQRDLQDALGYLASVLLAPPPGRPRLILFVSVFHAWLLLFWSSKRHDWPGVNFMRNPARGQGSPPFPSKNGKCQMNVE